MQDLSSDQQFRVQHPECAKLYVQAQGIFLRREHELVDLEAVVPLAERFLSLLAEFDDPLSIAAGTLSGLYETGSQLEVVLRSWRDLVRAERPSGEGAFVDWFRLWDAIAHTGSTLSVVLPIIGVMKGGGAEKEEVLLDRSVALLWSKTLAAKLDILKSLPESWQIFRALQGKPSGDFGGSSGEGKNSAA